MDECPICFNEFDETDHKRDGPKIRSQSGCVHIFCTSCITAWARSGSHSCPICSLDWCHFYHTWFKAKCNKAVKPQTQDVKLGRKSEMKMRTMFSYYN